MGIPPPEKENSIIYRTLFACCFLGLTTALVPLQNPTETPSLLLHNGTLIDGTGAKRRAASVRISGDTIVEIGRLTPKPNERVIDAKGLVIAPGFIDAHSHADGGILDTPEAETQVRQGITTPIMGMSARRAARFRCTASATK